MKTVSPSPELEERIGAAAEHVIGFLAGASITSTMLLGDELGLYRAMMGAGPVDVDQLADLATTHSRLTREWLDSQAAAGLVGYDEADDTYELDDAYAAVLAVEDSPAFLMGGAEFERSTYMDLDRLAGAFRGDGALGWGDHHDCLFTGVARFFRPAYHQSLVDEWLPALDGVVERLDEGGRVADVGCGLAHSSAFIASAFPRSTVAAIDPHPGSLDLAAETLDAASVADRVDLVLADAESYVGSFDLICFFDCLHDLGDPVGAARHAASRLRDGGSVMIVEPFASNSRAENHANPLAAMSYAASTFVCTPNAIAQGGRRSLGSQAGEPGMRSVFEEAGYRSFRRVSESMANIVYEARP